MPANDAVPGQPSATREHWDRVYEGRHVNDLADDDTVGNAALAHFGDVTGRRLLDLGCGAGDYSLFFARRGADVVAVDTSAVAVEQLSRECEVRGITNVHPVAADAFQIGAHGPFDLAFGSMILHHLEPFERFVDVLGGALTPGGRAFFYENSAMSRMLVWCREHLVGRFGIPKYGDDDEFPLQPQEIDQFRPRFSVEVVYPEVYLARLVAPYLLRHHGEKACRFVDEQLFRYPRLHRLSYRQYVLLTLASPLPV